jgi:excisionase family DNA binding protein
MELSQVKKPKLYTINEVAAFMEISKATLYRLTRSGKLKVFNTAKTGHKQIFGFRAEDIQDYYDHLPRSIKRIEDVNKQNLCGNSLEPTKEN